MPKRASVQLLHGQMKLDLKFNHKCEFGIHFKDVWPSKCIIMFEQVNYEMASPFWVLATNMIHL